MRVRLSTVLVLTIFCAIGLAAQPARAETKEPEIEKPRHWFVMVAAANAYPKLESERLIRKYFDGTMHVLAPGYDDVHTVGDLRDVGLLWTPYFGFGRTLGKRWSFLIQSGYTAGKVRTKANDDSIILLPLHTDFEIKRGALYGGAGINYYPFGFVDHAKRGLKHAKPFLGTHVTLTNATYRARVKVGFKPFPNLVSVEVHDRWLVPSVSASVGVDVPVSKRVVLELNAGYNFFFKEESDFEGPSIVAAWKFFIK